MHLLAYDATTPVMSIALRCTCGDIYSENLAQGGTHSVHLLPAIHRLLKRAKLSISEISCLVVANGPGSFTGLRIALATAKALAHPLNLPIYAVSTLRGLSYHGLDFDGLVLPMLDARRQQVYAALYSQDTELWPEDTYSVAALIGDLPKVLGGAQRVLLVGDGAAVHGKALQEALGEERVLIAPMLTPLLNEALGLLWAYDQQLGQPCTYQTLTANYLRISQAEREREQGINHAAPKIL